MNMDGSGLTPLTANVSNGQSFAPDWSPDGSKIVFGSSSNLTDLDPAAAPNPTINIWVMNSDGSDRIPLTDSMTASSSFPFWSPDGSRIVFESVLNLDDPTNPAAGSNGVRNIWTIHPDGTGLTPLTELVSTDNQSPLWSPDGTKVIFQSGRALNGTDAVNTPNNTQNIWIVKPDGTGEMPLTELTAPGANSLSPVNFD